MRISLGRILVALLLAAGVVVVPASSAYACMCLRESPQEYLRTSDAVFTGHLVDSELRFGGKEVLTFQVGRVYKGAVTYLEEVASQSDDVGCGLDLRGDGPFLVFADATEAAPGEPRYFAGGCTGTRYVSDTDPVLDALGPATPPDALPSETKSPLTAPELISLALLALVGAALAVLWRGRSRNRTTPHDV